MRFSPGSHLSFQGEVAKMIPTILKSPFLSPKHYQFSINLSRQVTDLVGVFTIARAKQNEETCFQKHHSARMFSQCFPVLPHGKHCFQRRFCFQEAKFASATRLETFPVSARHGSMAKRGNNDGNMFPRFARPLVGLRLGCMLK